MGPIYPAVMYRHIIRSPAEIMGSNPTRDMDIFLFVCCECYVLSGGSLRRADHSSRGILPTVMRQKTVRKQVKINRSSRWVTPEATIPLAKN
jgi:hypothetical protein